MSNSKLKAGDRVVVVDYNVDATWTSQLQDNDLKHGDIVEIEKVVDRNQFVRIKGVRYPNAYPQRYFRKLPLSTKKKAPDDYMPRFGNQATENAYLVATNRKEVLDELKDDYKKGFLNSYRVKKAITKLFKTFPEEAGPPNQDVNWSDVCINLYMYLDENLTKNQAVLKLSTQNRQYDKLSVKEFTEILAEANQSEEETTMEKIYEIKHLINGHDLNDMEDRDVFIVIRDLEVQIDNLKKIKTPSKKINKEIKRLEKGLKKVVEVLDAR